MASLILLLLIGFPYLEMIQPSFCIGDVILGCRDIEREALLEFKKGLTDPSGRLSSWHGEDCCKWAGVGCSNYTGHVIKLDLHTQYGLSILGGEVNPSLSQLKQLNFLDLSYNNFSQIPIPKFIGSLSELKYLNLSWAGFQGDVPPHIGNLSSLQYLDLSALDSLKVDNLHWLAGLSSLKRLSLRFVNLRMVGADWLQQVNTLPRLLQLSLQNCGLQFLPVSLPFLNFTSLEVLDLSSNGFNSVMPRWLFNCTDLKILDLGDNEIHGPVHDSFTNLTSLESVSLTKNKIEGRIPRSLGTLCWLQSLDLKDNFISGQITEFIDSLAQCSKISLKELDLSFNKLTGHLPNSVGNLRNLQSLFLDENQMNGTVPKSLGKLTQLVEFSVLGNSWDGFLSEIHFSNLQNLKKFQISSSSSSPLILNISSNWNPPFKLDYLYMCNCQVRSQVPEWLKSQHSLVAIVLRNAGISGSMPDWLMVSYPLLQILDLSYNKIRGGIPRNVFTESIVDLRSNHSKALLNLWYLNLGNNLFTGSIPSNIGEIMPKLEHLEVSRNLLNGGIPSSICKMTFLEDLILSNNSLSGKLPQGCWKNIIRLRKLDVSENNLSGEIPRTIGSQSSLTYLDLSHNNFSGELHSSLRNCTELTILDLGENHLSGNLPTWIGKALVSLKVLVLRSNMFVGHIPKQLCFLSFLQLLDVSNNDLQGSIPHCFDNLRSMAIIPKNGEGSDIGGDFGAYILRIRGIQGSGFDDGVTNVMVIKGIQLTYSTTLGFVRSIDLSSNHLSGGIPNQLTELLALGSLNLSSNHLTGRIPEDVGNLNQLELLDLSRNRLSGPIPQSLSNLTFLIHLNLSSNNFSGKIPTGHQLQTLTDPSIYRGNPELCGSPLETSCPSDEMSPIPGSSVEGEENRESSTMLGFYISMVLGFIVGFWGFCGTLFFKKSWRYVYFRFLERNIDKIHVFIAVKIARWKRETEMDIK